MRRSAVPLFIALGTIVGLTSCGSQKQEHLDTFETVWTKLNDTYFDPTFGGLDWKDAHDRYLPRIAAARNDEEFYGFVNEMLWELNVSHASLVPPGFLARREPLVCAEGSPGMDVRVLDGVAVVTSVTPGFPAQKAGLRPGYAIQAVDGIPVEQMVVEAGLVVRPPRNSRHRIALITKAILGRIYGVPGTEVSIAYSDERGEKSEKKTVRLKRSGTAVGPGGILYLAV
jgi:C-terminal processing protease CtpA/Prc